MTATQPPVPDFAEQLRAWRTRRRRSQLDLASAAEVSSRHLSFLETGRSRPSREMVLHLCEVLDVPLRDRNRLLLGAGLAPAYGERDLGDRDMHTVRDAMTRVLAAHEPNPAIVVDRHWDLVEANGAATLFMAGVAEHLLAPPVNVVRLSLHPDGLAPAVVNFDEYAAHMQWRLRRQLDRTGDPALAALVDAVADWAPGVDAHPGGDGGVVLPLRLRHDDLELELFSTISVFGAPLDVTLDELAIEAFYPTDARTAEALATLAGGELG